jgi:molybdopterin-containing oxidoreductase family iron-sulfur binding subunit
VPRSIYCGLVGNLTSAAVRCVVPMQHDLERWGIERAYDGTITPIQPLIEPIYDGRTVDDLLDAMLGIAYVLPRQRVLEAWARVSPDIDFATALARGLVDNTAAPKVTPALAADAVATAARSIAPPAGFELEISPHPFVHDGRYATNPWLLELPEPITKLTWEAAAQMSVRTSQRLGLETGDHVVLGTKTGSLTLPIVVVPGQADDSVTVHAGIDPAVFRLTPGLVEVTATDASHELAITQGHWSLEGRDNLQTSTLAALDRIDLPHETIENLYGPMPRGTNQWAMSIDLTTCTGCSACVMACAAENNTPVVGARQVRNGREMHWLRIDRYYRGPADAPVLAVQPMACQHCELAPCEYVCPVEATTHSPDGLNEMTYNRCIGTRFCSNNCPYKVRRFNWFDFKDHRGLRIAARNPDVTVRDRGVMEKCTYCVQRIRRAEIDARVADRPLAGSDVRTACQQVCPTQAIAFGSLTEVDSPVVEHRRRPHSYAVLHDQGTAPRTQYLARIRNPNGALP